MLDRIRNSSLANHDYICSLSMFVITVKSDEAVFCLILIENFLEVTIIIMTERHISKYTKIPTISYILRPVELSLKWCLVDNYGKIFNMSINIQWNILSKR